MAELITTVSDYKYDELIGGPEPSAIISGVTIKSGEGKLKRGAVLVAGDDGKYVQADPTKGKASAILFEDVDATSKDVAAEVYTSGMFNRTKLVAKGGDLTKFIDSLQSYGIYVSALK